MQVAKIIASDRPECEDYIKIIRKNYSVVLVVADGAGGFSGGGKAAQMLVTQVEKYIYNHDILPDETSCIQMLADIDLMIAKDNIAGETTAVIAIVSPDNIVGASVGDSGALLISLENYRELTENQQRRPFLGSGMAVPVGFSCEFAKEKVLLASDGLFKYTSMEKIVKVVRENTIEASVEKLLQLVRLSSGKLQDDTAIILCSR